MDSVIDNRTITRALNNTVRSGGLVMNLAQGRISTEYIIKDINTNDYEIKDFLFTLGCYKGEVVTLISILGGNYVIAIKDARYSIDKDLAEAIIIQLFLWLKVNQNIF